MALTRWNPRETDMMERMSRALDDAFRGWEGQHESLGKWSPLVNVYDQDGETIVEAELSGVDRKDIDVKIENNVLILKGERRDTKKIKEDDYYRRERSYGSFVRAFTLPESVERDEIEATFKDGVLTVRIPRSEKTKSKRIDVR